MSLLDLPRPITPSNSLALRCHDTISKMVTAFSVQDIDTIISLFADGATYCDVRGGGQRGGEYHGKPAIQQAFVRQFRLMGRHNYESSTIVANEQTAFASWTLVLQNTDGSAAAKFEGADHFELDGDAQVVLKKAWLKGQSRLARKILSRNPLQVLRYPAYAMS